MTLKTTDIDSMSIFLEKRDGDASSYQYGTAPLNRSNRGKFVYHVMMGPEREMAQAGIFPSRVKSEDKQRSSVCCGHEYLANSSQTKWGTYMDVGKKSDPMLSNVISCDLIVTTGGEENDHPTVTSSVCCKKIDTMANGNDITSMEVDDNCSEGEAGETTTLSEIPVPESKSSDKYDDDSANRLHAVMNVDETKSDSTLSLSTPSDTNVTSYDFIVKGGEEKDQILLETNDFEEVHSDSMDVDRPSNKMTPGNVLVITASSDTSNGNMDFNMDVPNAKELISTYVICVLHRWCCWS